MLATISNHLASCSFVELIFWIWLAAVFVGLGPWGAVSALEHVLAARRASQGIR